MLNFINQQKIAFMGIYKQASPFVSNFFTSKIAQSGNEYITALERIAYEDVKLYLSSASIVRREDIHPVIKLNNSEVATIEPELIKQSMPIKPADSVMREFGTSILINGTPINSLQYVLDQMIFKIKKSIEISKERASTEMFLTGAYTSPQTGTTVKYDMAAATPVASTIAIDSFETWVTKERTNFYKKTGVYPTDLFIGINVLTGLFTKFNPISNQINGGARVSSEKLIDGTEVMIMNVFGLKLTVFPAALDLKNKEIETKNLIYFYHPEAFLPAYVGVVEIRNGLGINVAAKEIIRTTEADQFTGRAFLLGESGYSPMLVGTNLVKKYEVTGL